MTTHEQRASASADVEQVIARVLLAGTVAGVALLTVGVILMGVNGVDPLSATFPPFRIGNVIPDMLALRPDGFLWAGIVILVATPIARVTGELITFTIRRDRVMALVALGILGVVALSVAAALAVSR